jgi:hypothetical protein
LGDSVVKKGKKFLLYESSNKSPDFKYVELIDLFAIFPSCRPIAIKLLKK